MAFNMLVRAINAFQPFLSPVNRVPIIIDDKRNTATTLKNLYSFSAHSLLKCLSDSPAIVGIVVSANIHSPDVNELNSELKSSDSNTLNVNFTNRGSVIDVTKHVHAVNEMDRATSPLAKNVIRLDTAPPGQQQRTIMPNRLI